MTFFREGAGAGRGDSFGDLDGFDERRLAPGAALSLPTDQDAELLTYVVDGAVLRRDATGSLGVVEAGEFQRTTLKRGVRREESNTSPTAWAHLIEMRLRPSEVELGPTPELKRFCVGDRRSGLCVVASPDRRGASLRIHLPAVVCSALLDPGRHVVHEIAPERRAWLHVVEGEVTFGGVVLRTGDAAGVTGERAVSVTARLASEILLVDLGPSADHARRAEPASNDRRCGAGESCEASAVDQSCGHAAAS